ncbi:MAG TPA: YraN family protein [Firmicutes bacterium]|nr:YraN family protein [Bacillota bacterium]
MSTTDLGKAGEIEAAKRFKAEGYRILDSNWRCKIGEIDLVLLKDGLLVFAEVKTRRAGTGFEPEESVTPTKAARLRRLAGAYLAAHPWLEGLECRFDVVCARVLGGRITVNVIENAF